MKKALSLSLLILIAGSGLSVTPVNAGFLDSLKNKALQYSLDPETIGFACLYVGLVCLATYGIGSSIFPIPTHLNHLNQCQNDLATNIAIGGDDPTKTNVTQYAENNVAINRRLISGTLAAGTSLTALGAYLLLKE
jgi:hypothetical protein